MGESVSARLRRWRIRVTGIVQGVGFRPFIYRLAEQYALTGFVLNDSSGVLIEAQGIDLAGFCQSIKTSAPPAAAVDEIAHVEIAVNTAETVFSIAASPDAADRQTLISPDLAICADCRREIEDINNRRYHYAFTNCTNCGPRFSIVQDIPYDRRYTTMSVFAMCAACQREYEDAHDRRFHAQPNACSVCGPQYQLFGTSEIIAKDVISKAHELLKQGAIVAVKGIGGYHLACDAYNEAAVARLRARKLREAKPFAVMVQNLAAAKKLCSVSDTEAAFLTSSAASIVLLKKAAGYDLANSVAPDNAYLGVMVAYAPIHCLLLHSDDVFVMTSANLSDEPIVYRDEDVDGQLGEIADYKLTHNRIINTRVDDSVVRELNGKMQLLRRSRGFAPAPVALPKSLIKRFSECAQEKYISVLGCGAELKSTFCLTKYQQAFISQHIGDLENQAVYTAYKDSMQLFERLFDVKPTLIACDLHPEYFSTKYAKAQDLPLTTVQHHHAHIASVLAEHDIQGDVIGVALDGTGYGEDGCIWGGEFMIANLTTYHRAAHFAYAPLPSGSKAVKEPWRLALWQAYAIYGEKVRQLYPELLQLNWQLLIKATAKGINAPLTSSAGRVFDTAAALLGICYRIKYEGQAAIELERMAMRSAEGELLPYTLIVKEGQYILDFVPLYKALYKLKQEHTLAYAAKSVHLTLAAAIAETVRRISKDTGLKAVAFSGGVCQNITLMNLLYQKLAAEFTIYVNEKVPPNDGGISFGQAAVALSRYAQMLAQKTKKQ